MKPVLSFVLWSLLISAFVQPSDSFAQKDALRIENGMMIVRFDKRLPAGEFQNLLLYFGLHEDSVWTYKNIGQLKNEGWQLSHLDKNMAEISKPLDDAQSINWGMQPIYLDDKHPPGTPGYPGNVIYGVNDFKAAPTVFENGKGETVFVLRERPTAGKVLLSGNFNDWSTSGTAMKKTDSGWVTIMKLKPGMYYYKFIVDGQWIHDPGNDKREDDGYSGYNSIYFKYNYTFKLDGYPEAKKVVVTGSFNGWNERELPMQKIRGGWKLDMFLNEGSYSYKFIVDKVWILDPANSVVRPDGQGNFNSGTSIGDAVTFSLKGYTDARMVILTGNFNDWNTAALSMTRNATGWEIQYVLAPGNYEYKFIVDGKWITDPANPYTIGSGDYINSVKVIDPNYTFVLKRNLDAKHVLLSGSFNNWAEPGYTMLKKEGAWIFPIHLSTGKYTYKFVVDDKWIIDPDNPLYQENEYGTGNSVIWIEPGKEYMQR